MRKVILEEWLSLDGFAVDRNGTLDFFPSTEESRDADRDQLDALDAVDTVLLGRRTYELFVGFWPAATTDTEIMADRVNALPKLVFSNTLQEAPWGRWAPARVVRGDAAAAVRRLKAEDGKDMIVWGSLTLAHALVAADLIDEYRLHVCPVLVGGGRRPLPDLARYGRLERVAVRSYDSGVVAMRYVPLRRAAASA